MLCVLGHASFEHNVNKNAANNKKEEAVADNIKYEKNVKSNG